MSRKCDQSKNVASPCQNDAKYTCSCKLCMSEFDEAELFFACEEHKAHVGETHRRVRMRGVAWALVGGGARKPAPASVPVVENRRGPQPPAAAPEARDLIAETERLNGTYQKVEQLFRALGFIVPAAVPVGSLTWRGSTRQGTKRVIYEYLAWRHGSAGWHLAYEVKDDPSQRSPTFTGPLMSAPRRFRCEAAQKLAELEQHIRVALRARAQEVAGARVALDRVIEAMRLDADDRAAMEAAMARERGESIVLRVLKQNGVFVDVKVERASSE